MKLEFRTSEKDGNKLITYNVIGNVESIVYKKTITIDDYITDDIIFTVANKDYFLSKMDSILVHIDKDTSRYITKRPDFKYDMVDLEFNNTEELFKHLKTIM